MIGERRSEWLETEFLIAICHPTGDKWQSKTLFLAIFDPRSSIVKVVFDCHLSGVTQVTKDFETLITGYAIIQRCQIIPEVKCLILIAMKY